MEVNLCDVFFRKGDLFVRFASITTSQWRLLATFEFQLQGIDIVFILIQEERYKLEAGWIFEPISDEVLCHLMFVVITIKSIGI